MSYHHHTLTEENRVRLTDASSPTAAAQAALNNETIVRMTAGAIVTPPHQTIEQKTSPPSLPHPVRGYINTHSSPLSHP